MRIVLKQERNPIINPIKVLFKNLIMEELLYFPSIISKLSVLLTFLHALLRLKTKKRINQYLFYILCISVFAELSDAYLKFYVLPYSTFTTFSVVVSIILWFRILHMIFNAKKLIIATIIVFSLFAFINLLFMEGPIEFNYYTLILGAFLYILFFVFESFNELKRDNFYFFQSNKYILIVSPIILFLGFSLLFFFKSHYLNSNNIIENVKFFTYFSIIVNVIFYSSLNYYILKENK